MICEFFGAEDVKYTPVIFTQKSLFYFKNLTVKIKKSEKVI